MLIEKLFDLRGKVVVISGGSGFIGSEISCALAEIGCRVALLYNNSIPNDETIKRLNKSKSDFEIYKCDVTNREDIIECKNSVFDKLLIDIKSSDIPHLYSFFYYYYNIRFITNFLTFSIFHRSHLTLKFSHLYLVLHL